MLSFYSNWSIFRSRWGLLSLAIVGLCVLGGSRAYAQQDGARAYFLAPDGTRILALYGAYQTGRPLDFRIGSTPVNSKLSAGVGILAYIQSFSLAGRYVTALATLPVGSLGGSVTAGSLRVENSSSGLGDAQIGMMVGLYGMPALKPQDYIKHQPGLSVGALAIAGMPTGSYNRKKIFNLGTNRWSLKLGLPIAYAIGQSLVDPALVTFELIPSIYLFTANNAPFGGGNRLTSEPALQLEGHVTRNLTRTVWVSADAIYQFGAGTKTDGVSNNDRRNVLGLGASLGWTFTSTSSLILSYSVIALRNSTSPSGQGVRAILTTAF